MRAMTYLMSPILRSPTNSAGAFLKTSSQVGEPFIPSLFFNAADGYCIAVPVIDEHGQTASVVGSFFGASQY